MIAREGYWTYIIGVTDEGLIRLKVQNEEDPDDSLCIVMPHESAVLVAKAMLAKADDVEYAISQAVERMTQF